MTCVFCDIVAGDAPASVVYRDDLVAAFMDIQPAVPGHTLVVPNRHAASLAEVDAESYWRVFEVGRQVAGALRASRLRVDGVLFWVSDGDAAGQEIFHMHLHVVPRFPGDGFEIRIAAYEDPLPARPLLDRHAVMLRTAFES